MSKKKPTKEKRVKQEQNEHEKKIGQILISPFGSAADALSEIYSQADFITSINELHVFTEVVQEGKSGYLVGMLVSQMTVLNALFNAKISAAQRSDTIDQGNYHADIAFRAQALCNRTMRTLLELKSPKRATFIKQQNNMQINQTEEKKEKKVKPANELLEVNHDARLDTRTQTQAGRSHTTLETVGKGKRTAHGTG